jgi:hypothetical protein
VKRPQISFLRRVRPICLIAGLALASVAMAEDADPLDLERAVHLETVAGDLAGAEAIYRRIALATTGQRRARAEATYRLADLYARQARNLEAKNLFMSAWRDFPESKDLASLAEVEVINVTALFTRDQVGTNLASMQHLGDLAIALFGALENNEKERSTRLLTQLTGILDGLGSGKDAPGILVRVRNSATAINAAMYAERGGGMQAALEQLKNSKDFEPFLRRDFPSDPNDVFAPASRAKDRLAYALAENNRERSIELAQTLERYLAPLVTLPPREDAGALARLTAFAARDILELAKQGKFAEARQRLDEFDEERHAQFRNFRLADPLPRRMPEQAVAAAWAVKYRAEQAAAELGHRGYAAAMDHVEEGATACREVLSRLEAGEVSALFKRQQAAFEAALWEIKNDRLGGAMRALKPITEKPQ